MIKKFPALAFSALVLSAGAAAAAESWTAIIHVDIPYKTDTVTAILPDFETKKACMEAGRTIGVRLAGPIPATPPRSEWAKHPFSTEWDEKHLPYARLTCMEEGTNSIEEFEGVIYPATMAPETGGE